jgi:hypothetical protein
MAWMNQEKKQQIAEAVRAVMPQGWKYSLDVRHNSAIVLTIAAAPVRLIPAGAKHCQVNRFFPEKSVCREHVKTVEQIIAAMNADSASAGDTLPDYVQSGLHLEINIGRKGKPFAVAA